MNYLVERFSSQGDSTLSIFWERGDVQDDWLSFGLEDEAREIKVAGETRIPAGVYQLKIRTHGGFHNRYKEKYPFHIGMIEVCDVPGFTDILIHTGNTDDHTDGCLLLGDTATQNITKSGFVGASGDAYARVYQRIIKAMAQGDCYIEYVDRS